MGLGGFKQRDMVLLGTESSSRAGQRAENPRKMFLSHMGKNHSLTR